MSTTFHSDAAAQEGQGLLRASAGIGASKNGAGLGNLVDSTTVETWVTQYLESRTDGEGLAMGFRYGVETEARCAGQSFVEAEPMIRSEWSSEKGRLPWESVRDAVWAGFDRARERKV